MSLRSLVSFFVIVVVVIIGDVLWSTTSNSDTANQNVNQGSSNKKTGGDVEDYELREFSEELLSKDTNNAARFVTVNLQGMTTSRSANDEAPLPLLSIDSKAYSIPSIEKLMLLYNNYILESNQNEVYTAQEKNEENDLLDTILSTPVMQHTRNFLIKKGKLGKDPKEFKDLLRAIWFGMYSRGQGRIGSSGFEHVFLAELKNSQVSGLHNWVYFNEEEKNKRANYLGYMKKIDLGNKGSILKYHFTFHDVDKPVGSMFIGTSPELEIALYSTCYILRADKICPLKMNGNRFIIRTFTYRYRGRNMIGSAFPEI
ncbi:poly(U)-specific endoribonuclease homolog isoform X2 [Anoplophora glabripennis]|uniref:poly(U)-specific endoribonuclease homolog isoform X2 n=1 Tax=Anoplophora glabripennis TaxID=217634 RepID=UPI0008738340|nr:poly(U)-specific endoribonuclease homolog isoform X2 [Anoplophora glabripennis]